MRKKRSPGSGPDEVEASEADVGVVQALREVDRVAVDASRRLMEPRTKPRLDIVRVPPFSSARFGSRWENGSSGTAAGSATSCPALGRGRTLVRFHPSDRGARSMNSIRLPVLAGLLALSVAVRLAPYLFGAHQVNPGSMAYPWNFSPILALSLFGGAMYASRRVAYFVPLAVYLLGGLGIWAVTGRADWAFHAGQPVVYLAVALVASCGFLMRGQRSWGRLAGSGLVAAMGFFVVTNFAVWAFRGGVRYPLNPAGLIDRYVQAIPFFLNSLVSMAVFLPLLFSPVSLRDRALIPRWQAASHHG